MSCFVEHSDEKMWHVSERRAAQGQQAADLIARIAVVMKQCGEEQMMGLGSKFFWRHMEVSMAMGTPSNGWFLLGKIPSRNG